MYDVQGIYFLTCIHFIHCSSASNIPCMTSTCSGNKVLLIDYKININLESVNDKYGVEKIIIDEVLPRPVRHPDDIGDLFNPFL